MPRRVASPIVRLQNLPREPLFDVHVWVDYIELLCLFSSDREISKADIQVHYRRRRDLGEGPAQQTSEEEATEIEGGDSADIESGPPVGFEPELNPETNAGPTEEFDQLELRIDNWFRHLPYRARAFDEFYPFYLTRDHDTLRVKSRLTLKQKLYVFFLLSSHLSYFSEHKSSLTSSFEILSLEALKRLLPANAEVHLFGSNPYHHGRYSGTLWRKIRRLSNDLRGRVKVTQDHFSPHDTGDKGLDVVGWIPFEDENPNMIVMFGGCACSKEEWVQKQLSSSAIAWSGTIDLETPPGNVAFVPICFRRENGSWHKPQDIHETILIDRLRFVSLLKEYKLPRNHRSYHVVSEMLNRAAVPS